MINNSKKYVKKSHNKTVQNHAKNPKIYDLGTKHCIDSKLFPKSAPKVNAKSASHN